MRSWEATTRTPILTTTSTKPHQTPPKTPPPQKVVKEVLRFRPPAPMVPQVAKRPFRLTDDYVAPKGAFIIPDIVSACHQGFTDAKEFDPDRFGCACARAYFAFLAVVLRGGRLLCRAGGACVGLWALCSLCAAGMPPRPVCAVLRANKPRESHKTQTHINQTP